MATMIIEGDRTKAASGKTYEVRNPATGEVVDEVPAGGAADVDRAAQAAAKAFTTWSKMPANKRAEILHKAAQHMLGKVEHIAPILTKEQGKTLLESRIEAQRFGENIAWFADLADKVHGQHVRLPDLTTYGLVVRRPIGVCGAIVPWNFPLTLAANKVAPAIAAGNTVVLKPASTTPLSTLACIEALIEGGLPEGADAQRDPASRGRGAGQGRGRPRRSGVVRRWPPEGRGVRPRLVHPADDPRGRARRLADVGRGGVRPRPSRAPDQGPGRGPSPGQRLRVRPGLVDLDHQHGRGAPRGGGAGGRLHVGQRPADRARRAALRRHQAVGLRQGARAGGLPAVHRGEVGRLRRNLR